MPDTGAWPNGFPTRSRRRRRSPARTRRPRRSRPGSRPASKQSSERICVEHANAEHKQWRPLQRYIGRREYYTETHLAIAGLVSDRTAER